ncbi:MAG: amino-acid N-acetyltransferase [Treponema sp.]|nr:amino-acid N-acetyltransferase [Treponema sp.]
MMENLSESAKQIRDVINYIKIFKDALAVIHIDDQIIDSPLLPSLIHDIALIHQAGLKVIVAPGARKQISEILDGAKIEWKIQNGSRVAPESAMPLIKTAAFDVANTIMNHLAGENRTAVIGNWVKARAKGVLDGTDYGTAGEIDKLKIDVIKQTLDDGFIPIFPCIGWNDLGKPYNISSAELAQQIACGLKAQKLFYILPDPKISKQEFSLPDTVHLSDDGNIPAMNLAEAEEILRMNGVDCGGTAASPKSAAPKNEHRAQILSLLSLAKDACKKGVARVHILNGKVDGILPCEIFSGIGSGTMVYNNGYGDLRAMQSQDIPSVLSLMNPFVQKGILLERTAKQLKADLASYIVYNVDEGIHACAALKVYQESGASSEATQAEICAVAVDPAYGNMGVGPKLINYLLDKARAKGVKSVFVMTTQTADFFEKLGFAPDSIDSIPPERKKLWNPERGSKVYRISL